MTRRIDDLSQGHTEPGHHNIQKCKDDDAFLIKKEQINYDPVQKCHHFVDECKMYDSSYSSVDSGIGSKDGNPCLSVSDESNENSTLTKGLDEERSFRKLNIIPCDSEKENKCGCHKRFMKPNSFRIFLSISIVGNIVLVVMATILATKLGESMEADEEKCPLRYLLKDVLQDSMCIPCNYLGSQVKAEDTLFDVISPCGYKFCCVRNAALQQFFLLMLQEGYTSEATTLPLTSENYADIYKTLGTWLSRDIAAHLYANVTSLPEKLTWQIDVGYGSAFTLGITLTPESRLKVPEAGFYYIYSAITFKCQPGSRPLIHMINRQHRGRPNAGVQQLLLSKTSDCEPEGMYTSFLAGVLKLTINDELSVNLTDFSLSSVYKAPLSNYFGVYLI